MRLKRMDGKGEMGIGTLVIFISMVLVSAIAAGVLMETVGVLQQQARETGGLATEEVSSGLEIISISGDRNTDALAGTSLSTIQVLSITMRLQAGSSPISLSGLLITVSDGNRQADLSYNSSGSTAAHCDSRTYVVQVVKDEDSSISEVAAVDNDDIFTVIISTDGSATNLTLGPGSELSIRIVPINGMKTDIKIYTPLVYTTRYITLW